MNLIDETINLVVSLLSNDSQLNDVSVAVSYPSANKPTVIKKPKIAVSLKNVTIDEPVFLDRLRQIKIKIGLNIFTPLNQDSKQIICILTRSVNALLSDKLNIISISSDEPCFNKEVGAFMLKSEIELNDTFKEKMINEGTI